MNDQYNRVDNIGIETHANSITTLTTAVYISKIAFKN